MMKIGLREANLHFSKYMKMVKDGKEVILTERGIPIAVIKPIPQEGETESKIKLLEEHGILKRARKGAFPVHKPITISGKSLAEIISQEREERF